MIEVQIWKLSQPQVNLFKIDPIKSQILKMQLLYFYCYESSCPYLKGVKKFPNISRPFLSGVIFFYKTSAVPISMGYLLYENVGHPYLNEIFFLENVSRPYLNGILKKRLLHFLWKFLKSG